MRVVSTMLDVSSRGFVDLLSLVHSRSLQFLELFCAGGKHLQSLATHVFQTEGTTASSSATIPWMTSSTIRPATATSMKNTGTVTDRTRRHSATANTSTRTPGSAK